MTILQAVLLPFMGFNLLYPPVIETGFVAPKKAEIAPVHRVYAINDEGFNPCSCISYLKYKSGIDQETGVGNAWDIKPNIITPVFGAWVLTYEGDGHASYLINWSDNHYTVEDYNFLNCAKSVRTLDRSSPVIKGLFMPGPKLSASR